MFRKKLLDTNLFVENIYLDQYIDLVVNHKQIDTKQGSCQVHHIVPRCVYEYLGLEVDDTDNNKVKLLYKDHALAHYYLFWCCSDGVLRQSLASAFLLIVNTGKYNVSLEGVDFNRLQELYDEYIETRSILYKGRYGYNKGRKVINNGVNEKWVTPETLSEYLSVGWKMGRLPFSDEDKLKKSLAHKNRVVIHNGDTTKRVNPSEVDQYLKDGYVLGFSDKIMQQRHVYIEKHGAPNKGYVTLTRNGRVTSCHPDHVEELLADGWEKGGHKLSLEHKQKIREKNVGRHIGKVHVHNENEHYMVELEKVGEYLNRGFVLGSGVSIHHDKNYWIHKDGKNKRVSLDEISAHLLQGWTEGMIKKKK